MKTYLIEKDLLINLSKELEYQSGKLFWKVSKGNKKSGDLAGYLHPDGAIRVRFNKRLCLAHRLIFALHYGYFPEFVDHIDGNRQNNTIENLRKATRSENNRNAKRKKINSSGIKGVSWFPKTQQWRVRCRVDNKEQSFGLYSDIDLAELVSIEVRNKYHKEFAKHK